MRRVSATIRAEALKPLVLRSNRLHGGACPPADSVRLSGV